MSWWVTNYLEVLGPVYLVAWIFWIIFSISLHELSHGWEAMRQGDRTPAELGHMTLNPMTHMGPASIAVFAICGITWGQMPVDESRMRSRHSPAFVAVAGPAMNLIIAVGAFSLLFLWRLVAAVTGINSQTEIAFSTLLGVGIEVNVVLALFNMLPFFPLDGGRVLANYWRWYAGVLRSEHGGLVSFGLVILMFYAAGPIIWEAGYTVSGLADLVIEPVVSAVRPAPLPPPAAP